MHTHNTTATLAFLLTAASAFAGFNNTNMVAWWSFDTPATNGFPENPIVEMDYHIASASGLVRPVGDNPSHRTEILTNRTNIGSGWVDHLQSGYLAAPLFANTSLRNSIGIRTYDGVSGYRLTDYIGGNSYSPGTVYIIIRPNNAWNNGSRRSFFGAGHDSAGRLNFHIPTGKGGAIALYLGSTSSGYEHRTEINIDTTWTPGAWYFLAATWSPGQAPRIFIRQMHPSGPDLSPPMIDSNESGYFTTGANYWETTPSRGQYDFPVSGSRPFAIGCTNSDTGNLNYTDDGADGQIAYFQLDKGYSSAKHVEDVFMSLAQKKTTTIVIR